MPNPRKVKFQKQLKYKMMTDADSQQPYPVYHPRGPCSAACSRDPTQCPYYQAVQTASQPMPEEFPDLFVGDQKDEKQEQEMSDVDEPYQRGDVDDGVYSPVVPYMDIRPEYLDTFRQNIQSVRDCSGLFILPSGVNMDLFLCDSFNQFCINFGPGKRTRLVTIIGEHHLPMHRREEFEHNSARFRALFIDQYIRQINLETNSVNKRLAIFLEDNPTVEVPYDSYNIWRIKSLDNFIRTNSDVNHDVEPILNIANVDIRYIGYEAVFPEDEIDFFSRSQFDRENILFPKKISEIYNHYNNIEILLVDTTIKDLRKLSIYLTKLLKYCCRLFKEPGRFKIEQIFNIEHLTILDTLYRFILSDSNEIKELLQHFRDYDGSTVLKSMNQSDISKAKIILKNFIAFLGIIDLYSMIQFFRKDYPFDDIIFLVGEAHAQHIGDLLERYNVKSISHQKDKIYLRDSYLNLKDTYF